MVPGIGIEVNYANFYSGIPQNRCTNWYRTAEQNASAMGSIVYKEYHEVIDRKAKSRPKLNLPYMYNNNPRWTAGFAGFIISVYQLISSLANGQNLLVTFYEDDILPFFSNISYYLIRIN